jgi:signal transduction histidine kinase
MTFFFSLPPALSLATFMALAVLATVRGINTPTNRLFVIICLLAGALAADMLVGFWAQSPEAALRFSRINHLFTVYLIALYIHFFITYLGVSGTRTILQAAYGYAFLLMCLVPTPYFFAGMAHHVFGWYPRAGPLYALFAIGVGFSLIYVLRLLSRAIREAGGIRRNRLRYLLAGFFLLGVLNGLNAIVVMGCPIYPPGNFSFIPLWIFAYGLFKHDLLDLGLLVRKSLLYSLLTALLTALYALIVTVANRAMSGFNLSGSLSFHIFFFLVLTVVFGPLKSSVQKTIDHVFARQQGAYRKVLKQLSRLIVSVLDLQTIGTHLTKTVTESLSVSHCDLFLPKDGNGFARFTSGSNAPDAVIPAQDPLVNILAASRRPLRLETLSEGTRSPATQAAITALTGLGADVVLPMVVGDRLNGFLVLGPKASGEALTAEDIDLLEALSSQGALAVENARSYQRIDALNRSLEDRVRERTQELQAALEAKDRTQRQLVRSESLAAIGQLVAGVAHEINNPLTSATSLVQTTIEDLDQFDGHEPPDAALVADLRFANKELGRAKDIVSSLLGLSRQTASCAETVNINAAVQDALRVLHNQYETLDLAIETDLEKALAPVSGNFAQLGQVVVNILKNAIQATAAMPGKGRIILLTRTDVDDNRVVFECQDNGPGIREDIRQQIFQPFFTTKEVGQGTGLGLYICHEIVSRHGGSLSLEDAHGQGARFVVRLPIANLTSKIKS